MASFVKQASGGLNTTKQETAAPFPAQLIQQNTGIAAVDGLQCAAECKKSFFVVRRAKIASDPFPGK
jgi:hypothetical protein